MSYKPRFMHVETFEWPNKSKIFDLLKQNEVSSAILISGDIHMAQIFRNSCSSLTGQPNLLEVTSSGLSHAVAYYVPMSERNFELMNLPMHRLSEPYVDMNYGVLEISPDLVFTATIKDTEGH